ncbi:hypothetical protein LCL61_33145 [Amycolatopsis coloradensis]|uniref:Uncharacterized protein n=1 Tax=Amycolatopsis coloradensis TaxID=76021 RepID=A0ACD5BMD9_9PSEU
MRHVSRPSGAVQGGRREAGGSSKSRMAGPGRRTNAGSVEAPGDSRYRSYYRIGENAFAALGYFIS